MYLCREITKLKTKGAMKKVFLMMLLTVVAVGAAGQGTWSKKTIKADELRGEEGGTYLLYEDPSMGEIVIWNWDEFQFRLISLGGQFNVSRDGMVVNVGIYDDNDKLVEKFGMWLDREDNRANRFIRTRDAGYMNNPVGQKKKVKKIFKALQSGTGYVRFLCERYNELDFDLKVLPYKE